MFWTKKHDQFALSCGFYESASYLARYCLRRVKNNQPTEMEIDLHDFNRWVGKIRPKGEYHRKTLSNAIAFLDQNSQGMIVILKRYTAWVYRLIVRPLAFVEKMERSKCDLKTKLPTQNPMFSEDHKQAAILQQQQIISKLDRLFKQVGLNYTPDALGKIWRLSGKCLDNIKTSIELLLFNHSKGSEKLRNPCGFIVSALTYGWYKNFDLYYQVELPYFKTGVEIHNFVGDLFKNPPDAATA